MKNQLILGDNLQVLRDMPSESVDLIYIDPPFFSGRHYEVIWGDEGEMASFGDRWSGGRNHYIEWLYKRVQEMHRVLKPTGSFYLHCDWHANAYIRVMILDKIFGDKNFVNEIIWWYKGNSIPKSCFPRKHDVIFCYSKGKGISLNLDDILIPYSELTEKRYNHVDENGRRYKISALRNGKQDIVYMKKGKYPDDVWDDVHTVRGKESIGYPTQKPEALLERIIKASSNPGDIVLDAFCGGGTTPAVARKLGRKFIGIDQSVRAIAVSNARLEKQTDLIIDDIYEVKTKAYSYDKLRNMDPFKFESLMIELFGGIPNTKKRGDGGKDGFIKVDGTSLPIQVKQMDNVGRPLIQNFIGYNTNRKKVFLSLLISQKQLMSVLPK